MRARIGIDRDRDGWRDADELITGTIPVIHCPTIASVPAPTAAPREGLGLAHPNPFASAVTLDFALARAGHVTLAIFDLEGRRVRTHPSPARPAGAHALAWTAAPTTSPDRRRRLFRASHDRAWSQRIVRVR
jgi:hypothetical protein